MSYVLPCLVLLGLVAYKAAENPRFTRVAWFASTLTFITDYLEYNTQLYQPPFTPPTLEPWLKGKEPIMKWNPFDRKPKSTPEPTHGLDGQLLIEPIPPEYDHLSEPPLSHQRTPIDIDDDHPDFHNVGSDGIVDVAL